MGLSSELRPEDDSVALFERAKSWPELVQVLESRAAATTNPAAARDHRAKAADVVLRRLSDQDRAVTMFEAILADDPAHPTALDALATLHRQREEWGARRDGIRMSGALSCIAHLAGLDQEEAGSAGTHRNLVFPDIGRQVAHEYLTARVDGGYA